MKELIVNKNDTNQRIDKYLKKILVHAPASMIYKMLRKKDVKVNGKKVDGKYIVQINDVVSLFLHDDKFLEYTKEKTIYELNIEFDVLYEDDNILVVNKPVGLLVHEDSNESINTLANQVICYLYNNGELDLSRENSFMPGPVHRLDRNTSGIVIFGKTLGALQVLNEMIKQRHCIEKKYRTIVLGRIDKELLLENHIVKLENEARVKLVSKNHPGSLMMKTIVKPISMFNGYSEVEVQLITGRMHQIRIHMSSIDHPIIGDAKYGDFKMNTLIQKKTGLRHQLLHAYHIKFIKPLGNLQYLQGKVIECSVPKEYKKIKEIL